MSKCQLCIFPLFEFILRPLKTRYQYDLKLVRIAWLGRRHQAQTISLKITQLQADGRARGGDVGGGAHRLKRAKAELHSCLMARMIKNFMSSQQSKAIAMPHPKARIFNRIHEILKGGKSMLRIQSYGLHYVDLSMS